MFIEPWCVEVSRVSSGVERVSRVCRGCVEGVSVDTGVRVSSSVERRFDRRDARFMSSSVGVSSV